MTSKYNSINKFNFQIIDMLLNSERPDEISTETEKGTYQLKVTNKLQLLSNDEICEYLT